MLRTRAVAGLVIAFTVGCGVPEISFAPDDAAGADALGDGAGDDSSTDAPSDAGADASGCPWSPPQGANACCGNIACSGIDCSDASCPTCVKNCSASQLCCVKGQSVTCKPLGTPCP